MLFLQKVQFWQFFILLQDGCDAQQRKFHVVSRNDRQNGVTGCHFEFWRPGTPSCLLFLESTWNFL